MAVILKRAYEPPAASDGKRYLVDRLWPRGLRREALQLDGWLKELAPSTSLRRWFGHVPDRWEDFKTRYRAELDAPEVQALLQRLARESAHGPVTLVFAAKDEARNEAVVLKDVIDEKRPG
jgi:uncharacterized protein YeaO (DUF488 family)